MARRIQSKASQIEFNEAHVPTWEVNAVPIGTTVAAVAALETLTQTARKAMTTQQTAYDVARAATESLDIALKAMNTASANIIKQIRTQAAIVGPDVYTQANIPAPATPVRRRSPGTCEAFKAALNGDGSLELSWKCKNTGVAGVTYNIYRRTSPTSAFAIVGGVGEKKFTDTTIPKGATQITYKIQAVRSTAVGQWAEFNVNFGSNVGGVTVSTEAVKLAA
jgi:hypothetical protein